MLNSAYAFAQFSKNFSKINTVKSLKKLIESDPKADLSVDFKSLPLDFSWSARSDQFTGTHKILLLPKIYLSGELYEAPCWQEFTPTGFNSLEEAFLKALKEAVATVQRNVPSKGSTPSLKLD